MVCHDIILAVLKKRTGGVNMTDVQQRAAAKHFAEYWQGKGYEKGESQKFWLSLLSDVFGVEHVAEVIEFEDQVRLDKTSFIDGYIPSTKVLIEQKSLGKSLTAPILQSDGSLLSPLQQAQRYVFGLLKEKGRQAIPRWLVLSNFEEFRVYDLDHPQNEAQVIKLADLPKEYYRLRFLVDTGNEILKKEMELSLKAGELVGRIHDRFLEKYNDPMAKHTQRSLNILCVRLVFCLYAEDAGLFGKKDAFSKYIAQYEPKDIRRALIDLFKVLDTPYEERPDLYLSEELEAFPYVNGGLFQDENIVIPQLTENLKSILLESAHFDWAKISPTIFGAVFESTLNPETRRSGGMHYTSIENIHKVIDPLFLDDLKTELVEIKAIAIPSEKAKQLRQYQRKLASLTFLDPACGSGNFLTETYVSLRRLENEVLLELHKGQIVLASEETSPIQVSISQFYGIEINDFAVTVAKTALWIAESQTMKETEDVVLIPLDFLPLKTNANIVDGNALRIDWNRIIDKNTLRYIMGNPPFIGFSMMSEEQKQDMQVLFADVKNLDYVSGWYKKASDYIQGTQIECGFVSTNSITQGETVARLQAFVRYTINFAHTTFVWDSEALSKAHVHCVIIGFATHDRDKKILYHNGRKQECKNINAYLLDAPNVIVSSRNKPLYDIPPMIYGNKPADGGNLIFTKEEKNEFLLKEPKAKRWMYTLIGGTELINNKPQLNDKLRYTLWMNGINPSELRSMPAVVEKVIACKEARLSSPAAAIRKFAETPYLYAQRTQPNIPRLDENGEPIIEPGEARKNLLVPRVSSERRKYVPMGYVDRDIVTNDQVQIIPDATIYHFGILESNVHMAWMRAICGRLKSDYRYGKDVVYNNFPWPNPTEEQKAKIEQTAQSILDARALYPDCSLADLYDELSMPPELRTAHQNNDRAVMAAYGMSVKNTTESSCVAELMRLYQEKTKQG